jgi:glutathione S-transferase
LVFVFFATGFAIPPQCVRNARAESAIDARRDRDFSAFAHGATFADGPAMNLRADLSTAATTLEPLFVWKKNHSLADAVDFASSTAATLARLGSGAVVAHLGKRPAKRLELYEREGCPFSRKVREALSILDLDAVVHPCPEGGARFTGRVEARLGELEVPFLIDDNAELALTDSDAIVRHLFQAYGDGSVPLTLRSSGVIDASSRLASRFRGDKGKTVSPSKEPEALLELYSYEASPHCRIVREKLSELEIPYLLHNVARRSPRRPAFVALAGKMQVPFLVDPQSNVRMFESREIVRYLEKRYAATA